MNEQKLSQIEYLVDRTRGLYIPGNESSIPQLHEAIRWLIEELRKNEDGKLREELAEKTGFLKAMEIQVSEELKPLITKFLAKWDRTTKDR